ncbi:unnamed protein product [Urochloa humidicola]
MRLGFIMTHCRGNPKFLGSNKTYPVIVSEELDAEETERLLKLLRKHKKVIDYTIRDLKRISPAFCTHRIQLEDQYKPVVEHQRRLSHAMREVVKKSWSLWISVVIFLLLNVNGWHAYFWMAFLPLVLLLAVGTKLEHVIAQLAYDVAAKHTAIEGDLVVNPSDEHFWFGRPRIVLNLIHFILFQNAFQLSFFFWILMTYGFDSCFMDGVGFLVPRLVLGVVIQLLCSYSTLPLYAIVTQVRRRLDAFCRYSCYPQNTDQWSPLFS